MKIFKVPVSFTVFLLFFGVSALEAFRTRNWMNVIFWLAIAVMFLVADSSKDDKQKGVSD